MYGKVLWGTAMPILHNGREIVTVQTAARMIGMSRRTLYLWMKHGKVEWVWSAGGTRRVYVDSLYREPPRQIAS